MTQLGLNWSAELPIAGRSPQAQHASSTGAVQASRSRGTVSLQYRKLLIEAGPLSDPEAARVLGRQLSTICSTRNGWGQHVVASGQYEQTDFGTKRVKWRWVEQP